MVCDDLEVVRSEGTSLLMAHAIEIMARVCQLERNALRAGVNQSFTIARSYHGDNIDLEEMETAVAPLLQDLADRIEGIVLPQRG